MDAVSFIVQIMFTKILKMLKQDLTLQILNQTDHYVKEIGCTNHELGKQIMKKIVGVRAKTYSYLKENNGKDKKAKGTKKCVIKRKLKFEDYKNCLEAAQIENKQVIQKKMKLMQIILKKIKQNL